MDGVGVQLLYPITKKCNQTTVLGHAYDHVPIIRQKVHAEPIKIKKFIMNTINPETENSLGTVSSSEVIMTQCSKKHTHTQKLKTG